ncbi:MAG: DNA polymerase III subunit beta [Tissierellia bacterium]|nr:DNA polymerase III subunit beta [Tissierellia bacterium]
MRIEINQQDLMAHIQIAQRAISNRTTLQILNGMYFQARDNYLRIISTDLELFIETKVPCFVKEEGEVVINSTLISNIVRKLPQEVIAIESDQQQINIQCQQSKFNLIGQDVTEYPLLPNVEEGEKITLHSSLLKEGTRQTVFAASEDQSRPYLTGVLLRGKEDSLHMVALDGFRVAFKRIETEEAPQEKIIIPARALVELEKILDDDQGVDLFITDNHILFDLGDTRVYSRLIEGNFINYEDIITDEYDTLCHVDKKQLQLSLERASLLARQDKANLVKLFISDHAINIQSNSEIGSVDETVPCEKEGEDLVIAFNAKYLLDGLKVIHEGEVEIRMRRSVDPAVMRSVDRRDFTYLVLPVRLAGEIDGYRD